MTTRTIQPSLAGRMKVFAGDIKISHTLFAMPWALLSMTLAAHGTAGGLTILKVGLILVCMVTARTSAMSSNRLLDAKLDAANPRTARRAIPAGHLSRLFYIAALGVCIIAFIAACGGFWLVYRNPWPLVAAPVVLGFVCAYPLLKRFSRLCHYYLGAALGLAPLCAWVAIRGNLALPPVLMGGAVLLWTAGFDILYACQDYNVDVKLGLFSVPAKLGIGGALWVSRITHGVCVMMLIALGVITPEFGLLYWIAVAIAAGLLVVEQSLVRADDLSKLSMAFFTVNGVISLLVGTLGIADILRH